MRYQAKDISTWAFMDAARRAHDVNGYASVCGVTEMLRETMPDLPLAVVLAKLAKLDRQRLMSGCPCGCSSPMWLVDPDDLGRLPHIVGWDERARVNAIIASHGG